MATKKKRKVRISRTIVDYDRVLNKLKLVDLQRECIMRGLPFDKIGEGVPYLQTFFIRAWNTVEPKPELLNQFDDWRKANIIHTDVPFIPLGFRETDEEGNTVKVKKPRGIKKKKKKRERNKQFGIFSGTKKELTYRSQVEGLTLEETINRVKEVFPDANDKSISIWYKKSKRTGGK